MRRQGRYSPVAAALVLTMACAAADAGSFGSAGETLGVDLVKHPVNYDGVTGGDLVLSVCLDPEDPESTQAIVPTFFAVRTWNARQATSGNISTAGDVPMTALDFESAALRALGLCLGLDDPSEETGFTHATNGANDAFDHNSGSDLVAGTRDDLRGDDQNLMWFRFLDNDPFTADSGPVDSSTMTRDTAILPEGDLFAATSNRNVGAALGFTATEAVMVDGLQAGESKRRLVWDDVATLRYAESGVDETEGTADDYRVLLDFIGLAASCDLPLTFDIQGSPATCFGATQQIQDNHYRFAFSTATFSDAVQWHFGNLELIFADGFESGGVTAWSSATP